MVNLARDFTLQETLLHKITTEFRNNRLVSLYKPTFPMGIWEWQDSGFLF